MKKVVITIAVFVVFVLAFLFFAKKIENGSGFVAPGTIMTIQECNGFYLETYNRGAVDGPHGGWCFGTITETQVEAWPARPVRR